MEPRPLTELLEAAEKAEALEQEAKRLRKEVADNLKLYRQSSGLTQSDAADAMGVNQAYLSQLEAGKKAATPGTLRSMTNSYITKGANIGHQDKAKPNAKADLKKARGNK